MSDFTLRSDAFERGDTIPRRHTGEGDNLSPPLAWTDPPPEARSLALVVDDPDAPGATFDHWLAWGIDPATGGLGEGAHPPYEGLNGFGQEGYRGPKPPRGHGPHRYRFRMLALDTQLDLPSGLSREELERALEGHVVDAAELVGIYER